MVIDSGSRASEQRLKLNIQQMTQTTFTHKGSHPWGHPPRHIGYPDFKALRGEPFSGGEISDSPLLSSVCDVEVLQQREAAVQGEHFAFPVRLYGVEDWGNGGPIWGDVWDPRPAWHPSHGPRSAG